MRSKSLSISVLIHSIVFSLFYWKQISKTESSIEIPVQIEVVDKIKKIPNHINEPLANSSATSQSPQIVDNPFLSEFGYTGTVTLRFEMTPEGKIADRTLRVDARNPVLRVIALRALRKALRNEENELRLPPESIL